MERIRKSFQGVWNIIRFNWHLYLLSVLFLLVLFISNLITHNRYTIYFLILSVAITISSIISLLVSFYVYDLSNLYTLSWLEKVLHTNPFKIVNIHAGFDETSSLLQVKFPNAELIVFDFYDSKKHTEVSIRCARKAYPSFANTQSITTERLPLANNSIDDIYLILAAHEIRNNEERIHFFKEIKRVISNTGKVVVTEHLRDLPNFLAYNIGFFHFHSLSTWKDTFSKAGLTICHKIKITPFVTTFIVAKNGTTS